MTIRQATPWLACICLGLLPSARSFAQLATEPSPFLPPGTSASASAAGGDSGVMELRGVMSTPEGARFCIYDPSRKASVWSGINERGFDFVVKSGDLNRRSVVVLSEGHTLRLDLKTAEIAAAATATAMGPGVRPNPGGPNAPALSPAEEAARLQAVAEEVRRRRQQRMQNEANGGPPDESRRAQQ